jgi:hypothetical protein
MVSDQNPTTSWKSPVYATEIDVQLKEDVEKSATLLHRHDLNWSLSHFHALSSVGVHDNDSCLGENGNRLFRTLRLRISTNSEATKDPQGRYLFGKYIGRAGSTTMIGDGF